MKKSKELVFIKDGYKWMFEYDSSKSRIGLFIKIDNDYYFFVKKILIP